MSDLPTTVGFGIQSDLEEYQDLIQHADTARGSFFTTHPDEDPTERDSAALSREYAAWSSGTPLTEEQEAERKLIGELTDHHGKYSERAWFMFLSLFAVSGNMAECCRMTGIGYTAVLAHKKSNPDFADAMEAAKHFMNDKLEAKLLQRALDDNPVFRKESDAALFKALEGRKRQIYGKNVKIDETHDGVVDHRHAHLHAVAPAIPMPEDRMERITAIMAEVGMLNTNATSDGDNDSGTSIAINAEVI